SVPSLSRFTVAPLQASVAVGAVNDGVAVHSIVASAPACPMVGGVVSTIVIVCVLVALWLLHASVASHLLVIVFVQPLVSVTSLSRFTVAPLQASVAVGAVNDGVPVHSIVASAPACPMVGGVVSTIVIVCVLVALWLLHASVASHVLVIVFVQQLVSVTSLSWFTVAPLQAFVAVGAVNDGVAVHSIVASAPAAPIVGGVVSTIVIVCVLVAE